MQKYWNTVFSQGINFSWAGVFDFLSISLGAFLQALAIRLFLVPADLVSGGVSGLAQMINFYTGWRIGAMILLGNLPLFIIGWRYLGGPRFALRTAYAVLLISFFTEALVPFIPTDGFTTDIVLNTLYGAVVSGIGYGLVYRGQGTSGGTDILARIINHWRGITLSQSYLITDGIIIFFAGLTFGWDNALYALVVLYVSGIVAEAVTEGSNVVRTAIVITNHPEEVASRIFEELERGVTRLTVRGAFTGAERAMLYIVISRSEVVQVKALVHEVDPKAFMVIGQASEALGEGFRSFVR